MPSLGERLQLLSSGPTQATAAILSVALPRARSDEQALICSSLAATGEPDAVKRAVAHASNIDDAAQTQVAQALTINEPALRAVLTAGAEVTTNLVSLLRRRQSSDSVHVLARILATAPWQETRALAAEAMLTSLSQALGPTANPAALAPGIARRIDETLAEAVDRYREHRCDAALHALALMSRAPGPRLSAILEESSHPAMFALRHAVARADRPELRQQLLRLIATPAMSHVIQRNMHRATGAAESDDVLAGAHLLRTPSRRKAMRAVDRPLRCVPTLSDALAMGREAQANLPLLIEALGLPTSKRLEHLADLMALASTLGRLRSAMALGRYDAAEARCALRPLAFDRSAWVARVATNAALSGMHRDSRAQATAADLLGSPHSSVARRARWLTSRSSAEAYFAHWNMLEHSEFHAAALAVIAREPDEFVEQLAHVLNTAPRAERILGLRLAQRMRLIGFVEQEVVVLAGMADVHIASAAITALGSHRSERTQQAIRVALRHTDPRVRANAVEAMARQDEAGTVETLAPLSDHRHNRLRANSVLALVRHHQPIGAHALRSMLSDDDPLHRVSGIWVAGRCAATFARSDLRNLVERDNRIEIRRRAALALRRIDARPAGTAAPEAAMA
jgi:hypothetical protein